MSSAVRVGIGYDVHRLVSGRPLVLGGVTIPHSKGLIGHSDADVVLHALADALLGAAGLPDLGELFPDTDSSYRGIESKKLLSDVLRRVRERGLVPVNVDLIVHAEAPKLSPYKRQIAQSVATMTDLSQDAVSVKAKTNEGLGPLGRGEGIACTTIVSLIPLATQADPAVPRRGT